MRTRQICRSCFFSPHGKKRSFIIPGSRSHYAPDLQVKLEHLALDIEVDLQKKELKGSVIHKMKLLNPDLRKLRLDQGDLKIESVFLNQEKTQFSCHSNQLFVDLPEKLYPESFEVSISYSVNNPRRGLYFIGGDSDYPKKRLQVWSQGQDENNRYWIPTFDYPNQKATTEMKIKVPKGFTAISNGALLSQKDHGEHTLFHYKLGTPHVTYLISLVIGEFEHWGDTGPQALPVLYFVPPGKKEDGKRAFGNTPKMIKAFADKIGVPYPYEKYSQVAVQDFIFGGMENTSATTQTDRTLHDAKASLDFSSDPLVSHELAHQWFGDLLTCRDWSHSWLNEGFATFMERVWIENNLDEYGSSENAANEAKYYSYQDWAEYKEEDLKKYRRSVVCNQYIEPCDLFDRHLYQKGGLILVLLRSLLGEAHFWKSIRHYVEQNREKNVETLDLIKAIEESTGRNMRQFFEEWVFGSGYPELEVSYEWHPNQMLAEIVVEQKQAQGEQTPLFHLPLLIEIECEGKKIKTHKLELGSARERVFLSLPSIPLRVRVDPGNTIPKTLKFKRPKEMLFFQLKNDPDCLGKIEAAEELKNDWDLKVIEELKAALLSDSFSADSFWGVRAEVARVLSEIPHEASKNALISALTSTHPKVRRAVVKALGKFKDPVVSSALQPLANSDPSYYVEAEAIYAWALSRKKLDTSSKEIEETEKFLISLISKESHLEVIRSSCFRALAELPEIEQGHRPKALDVLVKWSKRGQPGSARESAITALAHVAKTAVPFVRAEIFDVFNHLADEDDFHIQSKLLLGIEDADSAQAIPIVEKIKRLSVDGRVKRMATSTKESLLTSGSGGEGISKLQLELEKLQEELKKQRALIEGKKTISL